MYLVCIDQQKSYVQLFYKFKWLLNISIYTKNYSKRDIQSQITKVFARSLRLRLLGVISAFININIDLGISKNRKSNKQTHQI